MTLEEDQRQASSELGHQRVLESALKELTSGTAWTETPQEETLSHAGWRLVKKVEMPLLWARLCANGVFPRGC